MAITAGSTALATDFITQSEANATPSNDSGRVPQLESDGKLHGYFTRLGVVLNAGETINGATTPVPVYQNKTDNELYACDANDNTKYKFMGFVTSNGTDGVACTFQGAGIVGGFSGLDEGQKYYVQDTAGTIGTTPGTHEILVGIGVSTTQLLIQKGTMRASGTTSFSSTTTTAITLGFRPSTVRIYAVGGEAAWYSHSTGGWTATNGNKCVYEFGAEDGTTGNTSATDGSNAWNTGRNGSNTHTGVVTSVTDTGFTLSNTKTNTPANVSLYWEAEGEL